MVIDKTGRRFSYGYTPIGDSPGVWNKHAEMLKPNYGRLSRFYCLDCTAYCRGGYFDKTGATVGALRSADGCRMFSALPGHRPYEGGAASLPETSERKVCVRCGKAKPFADFGKIRGVPVDVCLDCEQNELDKKNGAGKKKSEPVRLKILSAAKYQMQVCAKCGEEKKMSDFPTFKHGPGRVCRDCRRKNSAMGGRKGKPGTGGKKSDLPENVCKGCGRNMPPESFISKSGRRFCLCRDCRSELTRANVKHRYNKQ